MTGGAEGREKTVLVVDDAPEDIAILEEILKADYRVKAVTNGADALRIARGPNPPDLILLDVMMPDMDGFQVCRELRADSEGSGIPVIFLTAKVEREDEKTGLELGAVDYIRKPVDPEIVRTRVRAHLQQKDRMLRISELRYRRLFETAQDGIVILDLQTGIILDANPAIAALMGASQEAFLGRKAAELDFLRTIMEQQSGLSRARKGKYVRYRDLPLETYDGRRIYVEFISSDYKVDRREVRQINLREITDLVAAERERDALSSRLSHYLSTSPTVTYSLVVKEGLARWQWVSENVLEVLGYTREEALAPDWWFRNVSGLDRADVLGIISDLSRHGTASREYRFARKDRGQVWLHDEMRYLKGDAAEAEIVGTLTDVTERKEAEEEILLKSAALGAAANAVIITNRVGIVLWANAAFCALSGYGVQEVLGKTPRELVRSGLQDEGFYRGLWTAIVSGKVWDGVLKNRRKGGELYDEHMTITPVLDEKGQASHFIAIKNDISQAVADRERLESTLHQKEVLLREIHHRVNNNMQVIISLLNLSARDIEDPGLHRHFDNLTRRMHAMAIIHEQFYETADLSRIDFAVFLQKLAESMGAESPGSAERTRIECERGRVLLTLEKAIPAGLIVSELLSNAMRHAFPDAGPPGLVTVSQRLGPEGLVEIEVRDEGIGLPAEIDPRTARTMGMTLINILSEQLGGEVEFRRDRGTSATLRARLIEAGG
ncbi:MAG TPA: PAS domain S-box protein [Spirochaetales bacterium]|nr:PAS domain S-box protein [Spirochaetales bacterium]HRY53528.1 PAS domain S-box protein [Spirochaetia bacterium]HRZ63894.1 PAS domain S-box protein [Spirochaetia bacterium]